MRRYGLLALLAAVVAGCSWWRSCSAAAASGERMTSRPRACRRRSTTARRCAGTTPRRLAGARNRHRQPRTPRSASSARRSTDIRDVSVVGSRNGLPPRPRCTATSRGTAAASCPTSRSTPASAWRCAPLLGAGGAASAIAFAFRVDTPYSTATTPEFPNPPAPPGRLSELRDPARRPGADHDRHRARSRSRGRRHPHDQRTRARASTGPLIYTPQGRLVWFDKLSGRRTPQRT